MDLPEDDDVVQALAPKRTDESLRVCVLPRGSRRRDHLLGTEDLQTAPDSLAVVPVSVPNLRPEASTPWEAVVRPENLEATEIGGRFAGTGHQRKGYGWGSLCSPP